MVCLWYIIVNTVRTGGDDDGDDDDDDNIITLHLPLNVLGQHPKKD